MPNSAKLVTEPADLLRNDSESFQDEGDPTNRGFKKNGFSPDGFWLLSEQDQQHIFMLSTDWNIYYEVKI